MEMEAGESVLFAVCINETMLALTSLFDRFSR